MGKGRSREQERTSYLCYVKMLSRTTMNLFSRTLQYTILFHQLPIEAEVVLRGTRWLRRNMIRPSSISSEKCAFFRSLLALGVEGYIVRR